RHLPRQCYRKSLDQVQIAAPIKQINPKQNGWLHAHRPWVACCKKVILATSQKIRFRRYHKLLLTMALPAVSNTGCPRRSFVGGSPWKTQASIVQQKQTC